MTGVVAAAGLGVAPRAQVHAIKVATLMDGIVPRLVAAGVDLAVSSGCHVLSLSLCGAQDDALDEAVGRALRAGRVVVASVRNEDPGERVHPAAIEGVAAVTNHDQLWRCNRGVFADWVCVAAPGVDVETTGDDGGTTLDVGASPAAAAVAGACALLLSGAEDEADRRRVAASLPAILVRHASSRPDAVPGHARFLDLRKVAEALFPGRSP
jgi:hypothetical protein